MEHKRRFVEDDINARNSLKNKLRCEYPGCKSEGDHRHILNLVNEEDANVDLPFCAYHYFIVIGGQFKARIHHQFENLIGEIKELSFELIGPFDEIGLIEQIIGAREMVAKLKSDDK